MGINTGKDLGFTLIELIIVIVVIGILAVSVVPRFMGNSGTTEMATVEARLLGLLRLQQQRSMQDTASCCYGVVRSANKVSSVTAPGVALTAESERDITLSLVSVTFTRALTGVGVTEFYFNSKGCPVSASGDFCGASAVEITLSAGTQNRSVCVQSQGYIHLGACS